MDGIIEGLIIIADDFYLEGDIFGINSFTKRRYPFNIDPNIGNRGNPEERIVQISPKTSPKVSSAANNLGAKVLTLMAERFNPTDMTAELAVSAETMREYIAARQRLTDVLQSETRIINF